jgi:hypothetical protein
MKAACASASNCGSSAAGILGGRPQLRDIIQNVGQLAISGGGAGWVREEVVGGRFRPAALPAITCSQSRYCGATRVGAKDGLRFVRNRFKSQTRRERSHFASALTRRTVARALRRQCSVRLAALELVQQLGRVHAVGGVMDNDEDQSTSFGFEKLK